MDARATGAGHSDKAPSPSPLSWRQLPRRVRVSTTPRRPQPGGAAARAAAATAAAAGGAVVPDAAVAATPAAARSSGQAELLLPPGVSRPHGGSSGGGGGGAALAAAAPPWEQPLGVRQGGVGGACRPGVPPTSHASGHDTPAGCCRGSCGGRGGGCGGCGDSDGGGGYGGDGGGDGSVVSGSSSGSSNGGGCRTRNRAMYSRTSSNHWPSIRRYKASTPLLVVATMTAAALGVLGLVPVSTRQHVLGRARRRLDSPVHSTGGRFREEGGGRGQTEGLHAAESVGGMGAPSPRPRFRARLSVGAWKAALAAPAVAPPPPLPPLVAASPVAGVTVWAPDRSACAGSFVWGKGAAVRLREVVPDHRASSAAEAVAGRPGVAASVRYMLLFTTVLPVVLVPSSAVGYKRAPRGTRVGGVWSPPGWRGARVGAGGGDRSGVSSADAWGFAGHERGDSGSGSGGSGGSDSGGGGDGGAAWAGNATLGAPIPGVGMALDHLAHTGGERRHGRDEWVGILTFYTLPGGSLTSAQGLAAALATASAPSGSGSGGGGPTLTISLPVTDEATEAAEAQTGTPPPTTDTATLAFSLACVTGWDAATPAAATPRNCPDDPLAVPGGRSVVLCSNALYGRLSGLDGIPTVAAWGARSLRGPASFTTVGLLAVVPVGLSGATALCEGGMKGGEGSAAATTPQVAGSTAQSTALSAAASSSISGVPPPPSSVADCVAASMAAATVALATYATALGAALSAAGVPVTDHHRLVLMPWCGLGSGADEAPADSGGGGPCSTSYMVAQFGAQYAAYGLLGGGHAWAASFDLDEFLGSGLDTAATPLPVGPAGTLFATTLGAMPGVGVTGPSSLTANATTADGAAAAAAAAAAPAAPSSAAPPSNGALLAQWVDFQVPDAAASAALTRRVTKRGAPPLAAAVAGNASSCVGAQGKSALHCSRGVGFLIHDVAVVREGPGAAAGLGAPLRLRPPRAGRLWAMHGRYRPRTGDCVYVGDSTKVNGTVG